MKKMLLVFACSYISCCVSLVFGENSRALESSSSVKAVPVTGLQFQEQNGHVPYSFYYPYDYGYYYPDTYGQSNAAQNNEECYSRLENGTFFYYCD
ncbi:hypothetical protein [Chlamydia vaughanii]|uniref:hypothetical protein n=1 Tax=Chlamydia vaughanii TaxID=3112552 RepID=UPI0032B1C952